MRWITRFLLLFFWLSSCGGSTPEPAGPITPPPLTVPPIQMAATAPPETASPRPATVVPTPAPPAASPTSAAATQTPTPVPSLTATLSVFEPPAGYIDPEAFPADLNPFTGLSLADNRRLQRPLAVKISNYPPLVRPQWGLNSADLVFEHLAEGGVTRFTALFYGHEAERVGSIRSGRLVDLEIPRMYDAAFAYSGASGPVCLKFRDAPFFSRIISPDFGHGGFERLPDGEKAFEHTLFSNTYTLHFLLDQRGENRPPKPANYMAFSREAPAGGSPAGQIELSYPGTNVFWGYQGDGSYRRWTDGQPHLDAADEEQLNARNVVVLAAHHQETDILEDEAGGGHYSIEIQIWGEGPVSIFRDGLRYDGRWQRREPEEMLTFVDLAGNPLPLAPGRTYFQLVPLGFDRLLVSP